MNLFGAVASIKPETIRKGYSGCVLGYFGLSA